MLIGSCCIILIKTSLGTQLYFLLITTRPDVGMRIIEDTAIQLFEFSLTLVSTRRMKQGKHLIIKEFVGQQTIIA